MKSSFIGRQGFLYDLLRYHLGWSDQNGEPQTITKTRNFQSFLAMAVCETITGEYTKALPVAAAIELICNFIEVHGEVQGGRIDSDNYHPTIWWVWGPAQAINAGDGLHALARSTMMRLAHNDVSEEAVLEAMRSLDSTCLTLCEGQYLDLTFQDQLMVSSTDYFAMVDRKSGSLAECSAKLGAVINGMDADITSAFGGFGKNLGMAWQIKQDMDDLWGKSGDGLTPNNLLNKKKSLPIIYALESGSTSIKREIGSIYMKRVLEPSDISRVLELLNEVDAKTYAVGEVATRVKLAKEQVMATGISGENLDDFIDNVIGLE